MSVFKAGSASIAVNLGEDCFPNAEAVSKHDDVYVRAVIFGSDKLYAVLSADVPSMFPADMRYCKELLKDIAGVSPCDSWITVSHSMSAPHTWPLGDNEQKDTPRPKALDENPEMRKIAERITMAYRDAYKVAAEKAFADMKEATVGFASGACAINANRNIYTVEGWWQGVNHEGFADRKLTVVRFNDTQGTPIAILYNYSINTSVAAGMIEDMGGKVNSSDLVGVASAYIEKEYGEGCTAIFMNGASGDQVPLYKINYTETDKNIKLRKGSFGSKGYVLMEAQGEMLGNAVVMTAEKVKETESAPEIKTGRCSYTCKCQKRETDMGRMQMSLEYKFIPNGTRDMDIDVMLIGDIALVGLRPELDGITVSEIRSGSPFEKTLVASFVNGNAKSMPQKESYQKFHYGAMNSPFVEGTAEQTRDAALALLSHLHTNTCK